EAIGLVQGLALQDQVLRLGRAGLGQVAVEGGQARLDLVVGQLQLGQHQHGLVVVVVLQAVVLQRLLQVRLGGSVVIQVVGSLGRELRGQRLVVGVAIRGGQDLVGKDAGL